MKVNFWLFKELLDEIPWETVLRDKRMEQSQQLFKNTFLRAKELSILQRKKSSRGGRKAVWLCKDLLVKMRDKKQTCRQWKQGGVAWEEHRGAVWMCREGIKKAKVHIELNLVRGVKNNKKGFYGYIGQKRQTKKCVLPS